MTLSVMEHRSAVRPVTDDLVTESVALYLIQVRRNWSTLFLPPESIEICVAGRRDRVRSLIRRMMLNKNRIVRWFGGVTRVAHRFYQKLEDRIDPLERMIKALNHPQSLRVFHGLHGNPRSEFRELLQRQKFKHTAWLVIDGAITAVAIMFFWVLVPLPGPNVFFYYPLLRFFSHFSAMSGARKALGDTEVEFEVRPELERLESRLRAGATPEAGCASAGVGVNGLQAFLERMA